MWSSTKPRTRAFALGPLNGCPVTFTSTSGKVAQPWAGANDQRGSVEATWTSRPSAPTPRCLSVDTFVSRSVVAVVGYAPVRRRSRGGGRRERVERAGARHALVRPVEQVAAEVGGLEAEGCGGGSGRGRRGISERIPHDEAVGVRVAEGVAAVREGVDVNGGGGWGEERTGGCARDKRDGGSHGQSLQAVPLGQAKSTRPLARRSPRPDAEVNAGPP